MCVHKGLSTQSVSASGSIYARMNEDMWAHFRVCMGTRARLYEYILTTGTKISFMEYLGNILSGTYRNKKINSSNIPKAEEGPTSSLSHTHKKKDKVEYFCIKKWKIMGRSKK